MLVPSTDLPDAFIGFLPVLAEPIKETMQVTPEIIRDVFVAQSFFTNRSVLS
jgi:hypothetical protein